MPPNQPHIGFHAKQQTQGSQLQILTHSRWTMMYSYMHTSPPMHASSCITEFRGLTDTLFDMGKRHACVKLHDDVCRILLHAAAATVNPELRRLWGFRSHAEESFRYRQTGSRFVRRFGLRRSVVGIEIPQGLPGLNALNAGGLAFLKLLFEHQPGSAFLRRRQADARTECPGLKPHK